MKAPAMVNDPNSPEISIIRQAGGIGSIYPSMLTDIFPKLQNQQLEGLQ